MTSDTGMSGPGVFPSKYDDPHADETTQPFWTAALKGQLTAPKCISCGTVVLPPRPRCFNCQSASFAYTDLPGTGTIYSFTIVRHPLGPHLVDAVPYISAVVELDGTQGAGARMILNVVNTDVDTVRIGDRVKVIFDRVSDTLAVPRAVPATD
ncbi:MAG TPA: OB-fold domain-containing protein [Amycolatopsis sp.]|nr:OB-fold domain-containing protein [Amycolatopsis sp.]